MAQEEEEKQKKLNDDAIHFLRKRSETEAPRYAARLQAYVNIQRKHRRAAAARCHCGRTHKMPLSGSRKKADEQKVGDQPIENAEHRRQQQSGNEEDGVNRTKGAAGTCSKVHRTRSLSRSTSGGPSDRCCKPRRPRRRRCSRRRRRRRCSRRRRRRSRRRRRRSCCRRRRRRRSRRRRRLSCRRRRRRSRRRRRRPRPTCCRRGCGS